MENKSYSDIIGSSADPYTNSLAQTYGLASAYYGVSHPSLPNYLALTGGDTFGIQSDCTTCTVSSPNLVDSLEAGNKSWKAYMENMPSPCFSGDAYPYAQKHNPFIYYDDIRTNPARCNQIVPLTQLQTDLSAQQVPDFVWITPNICSDTHDCPSSKGDSWLSTWIPQILRSPAWKQNGALFITWDEGDSSQGCCQFAFGGHIPTIVISPMGKQHYQSSTQYDHYSLLQTIIRSWNLPELGHASTSSPMSDFFQPAQ